MKNSIPSKIILSALIIFFFSSFALAQTSQTETTPQDISTEERPSETGGQSKLLQISLWKNVQLFDSDTSIALLRINTLYGFNKDVGNLDIGGVGRTSGSFTGLQFNLLNLVGGELKGMQTGLYNSAGDAKSIQTGIINTANNVVGWQIGIINHAVEINGMQVGLLYNTTENLKGLQIGLLNMNWSGKPITFLPIINFSF